MNDLAYLPRELSIGFAAEFLYPKPNRTWSKPTHERRRFFVERIRDLVVNPLLAWELRRYHDVRRSRFLVTGHDLDRLGWRSFYVGSIQELAPINERVFRLALYDPTSETLDRDWFSPVFLDTPDGRKTAQQIVHDHLKDCERDRRIHTVVGAFPIGAKR